MKAPQATQQLGTSCSVQLLQEGAPGRKRGRVGQVPPLGCPCLQRDRGCRHRALPRPQVRSTFLLQENESGTLPKGVLSGLPPRLPPAVPVEAPLTEGAGYTAHHLGSDNEISTQHTIACLYSNTCLRVPCSYMPLSPLLAYSCAQDQIQLNCCRPSPGLNSSRSFQGVFG